MKLLKLFQPSDEALLNSVKVASPCHESWEGMSGGDKVRSCDRCQKKVYNLSEMTAAEAAALVREAEGRVCVRFYRRADGTMLTTDCPVGASAARAKKVKVAAAWSGAAAAAAGVAFNLSRPTQQALPVVDTETPIVVEFQPTPPQPVMGDMEVSAPVESHAVMGAIAARPSVEMGKMVKVESAPVVRMGEIAPRAPKGNPR